jgi:hypothetical protein
MSFQVRSPSTSEMTGLTARANRNRIVATSRHRQRRWPTIGLEVAPRGKTLAGGDQQLD